MTSETHVINDTSLHCPAFQFLPQRGDRAMYLFVCSVGLHVQNPVEGFRISSVPFEIKVFPIKKKKHPANPRLWPPKTVCIHGQMSLGVSNHPFTFISHARIIAGMTCLLCPAAGHGLTKPSGCPTGPFPSASSLLSGTFSYVSSTDLICSAN